jgi:hypothetical protein
MFNFKIRIKQILQNSILTRWFYKYYQHEDTGYICIVPIYKRLGKRWFKCNIKNKEDYNVLYKETQRRDS